MALAHPSDAALAARSVALSWGCAGALLIMVAQTLFGAWGQGRRAELLCRVYASLCMGAYGLAQAALLPNTLSSLAAARLTLPEVLAAPQAMAGVSMGLASCWLVLLVRHVVDLKSTWPRADQACSVVMILLLLAPALMAMSAGPISTKVVAMAALIPPAGLLCVTACLTRRGLPHAGHLLVPLGALVAGLLLTSLRLHGLVPGVACGDALPLASLLPFALWLPWALARQQQGATAEHGAAQQAHARTLEAEMRARTQDLDAALNDLTATTLRLHALSEQDTLTGLKNRMFLSERMPEIWLQAQRWQTPLSVLLIDIDHLRRINDRHGHLAGDEALRLVAAVIARTVQRPGDHAVRHGGDQFLVLLPQTHTVGAAHIAETIRRGVETLRLDPGDATESLTVSIGVASVVPRPELAAQALLNAAEQLLKRAKQQGRNRCALIPEALATVPRAASTAHGPDDQVKPQAPATPPAAASSAQT